MSSVRTPPRPDLSDPDQQRPRRRWWHVLGWVLAGVFAAALLASVGILIFVPKSPETPGGPASPPAPGHPGLVSTSVCGLPDGDQTIPTTTPPVTSWVVRGTLAAPASPDYGPGRLGQGLPYCYAHNPTGALYAAVNFVGVGTDPTLRADAARYLTAAGPGRQALTHQLAGGDTGGPGSSDFQLAGFTVNPNYRPDAATVDLAFVFSGQYAHTPIALRWEAGDWKVVPSDAGDVFAFQALPDIHQYIPWRGR